METNNDNHYKQKALKYKKKINNLINQIYGGVQNNIIQQNNVIQQNRQNDVIHSITLIKAGNGDTLDTLTNVSFDSLKDIINEIYFPPGFKAIQDDRRRLRRSHAMVHEVQNEFLILFNNNILTIFNAEQIFNENINRDIELSYVVVYDRIKISGIYYHPDGNDEYVTINIDSCHEDTNATGECLYNQIDQILGAHNYILYYGQHWELPREALLADTIHRHNLGKNYYYYMRIHINPQYDPYRRERPQINHEQERPRINHEQERPRINREQPRIGVARRW